MFRSEALRTRYIIRSEEPCQRHRNPGGSRWALLNASLKASCSPQEKPHASTVDRQVLLKDSLKAGREMAARTNGMSRARIETEIVRKLDG